MASPEDAHRPQRDVSFAQAERQFARSILLGLVLLGGVALIGPVLSYRSDLHAMSGEVQARVAREASVYAEALGLHFEVLQAELERLAARDEINLLDNENSPEAAIMGSSHHHSALFKAGVAVLDFHGNVIWSEPKALLASFGDVSQAAWFQTVLAVRTPLIAPVAAQASTFVVAVPVLRAQKSTGVLVGMVSPTEPGIPGGRPVGPHRELVVLDGAGNLFLPAVAPEWAAAPSFMPQVDRLLAESSGSGVDLGGHRYFAAATSVGATGLRLVLLEDETAVLAPVHSRFLAQLVFIGVLQGLTLLLFSMFLRRSYQHFVGMEERAARQQRMAALGSAASLIAHEVRNSLNGLNAAAALLSSEGDPALPVRSLRGQIDRLRHLASSLLHFGKPARAQLVATRLDDVAREAVEGLRVLPETEDVELTTELEAGIEVLGDPLLLATALDNLIRNAIEAAVAAKDLGKLVRPRVRVRAGTSSATAFVRVEDNAGGPPLGFEDHLFEPFVTSKPKGIGLGLSMARQAMEQQGGRLVFERIPDGCAFTLELARPSLAKEGAAA